MSVTTITVEAVFDGAVLRPLQPLPLAAQERVTLTIQAPGKKVDWPEDAAEIYRELAAEDGRLAESLFPTVRETWPR